MRQILKSIIFIIGLNLMVIACFPQNHQLSLRYRSLDLNKIEEFSQDELSHAIYQDRLYLFTTFTDIPNPVVNYYLEVYEVELIEYLGSNTYVLSIPLINFTDFQRFSFFHSFHLIQPTDKLHERLQILNGQSINQSDYIDVSLNWFKGIDKNNIVEELAKSQVQIRSITPSLQNVIIRLPYSRISMLANQSWVCWIEPLPPPFTISNLPGRTAIRSNVISKSLTGRDLTGKGINMGIWDAGQVGSHIDFNNRLTIRETDYPVHSHGTHVAGTMAGAGILDPYYKGMAPEAKIFSYDFYWWIPHEMDSAYRKDSLVITQNSYYYTPSWDTCYKRGFYDIMSYLVDRLVKIYPNYIHVYAAGNAQSQCSQGGYRTLASGPHSSKNALVVGAVDYKDNMSNFSNWGPVRDGRLKPEICGDGVAIKSTYPNDVYSGAGNGTSFACPAVSGTIAQLYQLYRQLYNRNPEASTIKAIVCNSALDLGNEGPDFQHGFGRLDALKSAEIIEKKQFLYDSIFHQQFHYDTLYIDSSVKELKVMLCWSDAPASAYKKEDSISLVNHLDLVVYDQHGNPFFPFVLDPFHPDVAANNGIDTLNNIEQVVIKNPTPGKYIIAVEGKLIPIGYQPFSICWHTEKNHIKVTYPVGHENLIPGNSEIIRWNAFGQSGSFIIEFSSDSGQNWQIVNTSVPNANLYHDWTVPAVFSKKCLIRVSNGLFSSTSEDCFSIMNRPEKPFADACKQDVTIRWDKLSQAASYDVFELKNEKWLFLANVIDTFYKHTISNDSKKGYYTIKAIDINGVRSEFASAISTHDPIQVSLAKSVDTICYGQAITLTANATKGKSGNYSYSWKDFSETKSTLIDSPVKSRFYFVEVTDNCTLNPVKDSIFVFVRNPLSIKISASRDSICSGDSVNLSAVFAGGLDSNYYHYWSHNLSRDASIIVQPLQTTTYYMHLSDSCSKSPVIDSHTVIVREALSINLLASEDTICDGEMLEILSNADGGDPNSYVFQWEPNMANTYNLKLIPDSSAYFKLSLFDNCTAAGVSDSLFIAVQQMNAEWIYLVNNLVVQLAAKDMDALSYKWYFGDGDSSSSKSTNHTYAADGTYNVCLEVKYANDCTDSSCSALQIKDVGLDENDQFMYAIYPNPSNGLFTLSFDRTISKQIKLRIYSSLGKNVFEKTYSINNGKSELLDLQNTIPGFYFIELKSGSQTYTQKIVIF